MILAWSRAEPTITTDDSEGIQTYLIILKSKQLFPEPVSILHFPLFGQPRNNLIMSIQKGITIAPDSVRSIAIFNYRWVPAIASQRKLPSLVIISALNDEKG
jgi:hypothetical protein